MSDGTAADSAVDAVRRTLLHRVAGGAAALAALATGLARSPRARAAPVEPGPVSLTLRGGTRVQAALALPAGAGPGAALPMVLLIHEWWGLTDPIRRRAADLAGRGYAALAVDLMGGRIATTPEAARAQMAAVDPARATETLIRWMAWLRARPETGARLATLGWGFGGGWALAGSLAAPTQASVVYYGRVNRPASDFVRLQGPVLGHFAERDPFLEPAMVDAFVARMAAAGRALTVYWYDAGHAFANPAGPTYDAADADRAWERTLSFLAQTLKAGD
ncbi:MAG: dienelactone hydrolase family protein [Alphaproteobacteria bacterium]|nr:dienelactone hydrolase family protein [Alphaproteobacteria bacterium]